MTHEKQAEYAETKNPEYLTPEDSGGKNIKQDSRELPPGNYMTTFCGVGKLKKSVGLLIRTQVKGGKFAGTKILFTLTWKHSVPRYITEQFIDGCGYSSKEFMSLINSDPGKIKIPDMILHVNYRDGLMTVRFLEFAD